MPVTYDFDSPVISGSPYDAAAEINAILRDHDNVRLAVKWPVFRSTAIIPAYKMVYAESPCMPYKNFNGPMFVLGTGGFQTLRGLRLEGNADGGFSGDNVFVEAGGGWQNFDHVESYRSAGHGVHMEQPHAGHMCRVEFCNLQGSPKFGTSGLKLPNSEATTGGLRKIIFCTGGGEELTNIAGANTTIMIGCDTRGFRMNDNSNYGMFGFNRLSTTADRLEIRGHNHGFICNTIPVPVHIFQPTVRYKGGMNTDAGVVELFTKVSKLMSKITKQPVPPLLMNEGFSWAVGAEKQRWLAMRDEAMRAARESERQ
jgi:hypothetical protein